VFLLFVEDDNSFSLVILFVAKFPLKSEDGVKRSCLKWKLKVSGCFAPALFSAKEFDAVYRARDKLALSLFRLLEKDTENLIPKFMAGVRPFLSAPIDLGGL